MSVILVSPTKARAIAENLKPSIVQGFKSLYDLITPIHAGEFCPSLEPAVYYIVRESTTHLYVLYCFFHRKDWSELPWPIESLDEHDFDFEGMLVAITKKDYELKIKLKKPYRHWLFPYEWAISVSHTVFKYANPCTQTCRIEHAGHGVTPGWTEVEGNRVIYVDYGLINLDNEKLRDWIFGSLRKPFNKQGVKLPDQWNDSRIRRKFGKDTDGLIYSNPEELRSLACRLNLFPVPK